MLYVNSGQGEETVLGKALHEFQRVYVNQKQDENVNYNLPENEQLATKQPNLLDQDQQPQN